MEALNNFAYWLVGADMSIVDRPETLEKDKKALILTGWLIALAVIVSTIVAVCFTTTFTTNYNLKVFLGIITALLWVNIVVRIDRSLFAETRPSSLVFRILFACFTSAIISIPIKMIIMDSQIENNIREDVSLFNQQLEQENFAEVDSIYGALIAGINNQLRRGSKQQNVEYLRELRLQKTETKQEWETEKAKIQKSIADRYREPDYSTGNKFFVFLEMQKGNGLMNWLLIICIFIFESSPCWLRIFYYKMDYLKAVENKNNDLVEIQEQIRKLNHEMNFPPHITHLYNQMYREKIEGIKTGIDNSEAIENLLIKIDDAFKEIQANTKKKNGSKPTNKTIPKFDYQEQN